ncbi:Lipoprotein-releasing system ATP-binding protein LolD [bacterium HR17]|uniref:Lipoprotein-releasing system ATP-binding protein LolD n=1 Tax=Candidatus Fervidibacter japonicus TaxID=2035412 RepID=A0A2H5XG16_9BACT|nr:Lipoprotein-releasing system ATP-binding protein LolD [bacterium HR17]
MFDGQTPTEVLKGITLAFQRGEFASIVGPSGSGKSTLLYLLSGLDKPTAGRVEFDGVDLTALNEQALAEFRNRRMGFVFQFHFLLPEFTALENAAMPLLIAGVPRKDALDKAAALLQRVGLGHRLRNFPSQLSGGEQQRVAIARALVNDPDIVFCDEPTGMLDSKNAQALYELLRELNTERRQTIIVVTHEREFARRTDRIIQLQDGQVVADERLR